MTSIFEHSGIDEAATRVEVVVFLPANAGCNQSRMFIDDTDIESAPGLHFVVLDADGPLLKARFVPQSDFSKDGGKRLQGWHDSGHLKLIQLGKRDGIGSDGQPGRKLFGAGGDVEVGREIVQRSLDQIKAEMTGKDLVINWGAGGGGTGTAALEEIAKVAKELEIPLISILITPFANEGSKIAIADDLRRRLRELGQLLVIKNENLPKEKRDIVLSEAYLYINRECRPIFRTLREYTQVVGVSNIDLMDLLKARDRGRDLYIGIVEIKLGDSQKESGQPLTVDTEQVVQDLLNHTFQEKGIKAGALLFCFKGPWTVAAQDEIMLGIQQATDFPHDGLIKKQTCETWEEMWVSVIAFGSFEIEPIEVREEAIDSLNRYSPEEIRERYQGEELKAIYLEAKGKKRIYRIPNSLLRRWNGEKEKPRLNHEDFEIFRSLAKEIRAFDPDLVAPDLPALARYSEDKQPTSV